MLQLNDLQHAFLQSLLSLNTAAAKRLVATYGQSASPVRAVEELVAPALEVLGTQWEQGTAALSQVYMAGRICEQITDELLPSGDADPEVPSAQARIAIAVISDRHMLGKRIVGSVLRASGWAVRDYGHGSAETLAARARDDRLHILLVSALMLPSALEVKQLTAALSTTSPRVRVAVGGAPFLFDDQLWREVGADAFGRNATDALGIVRRWSSEIAACPS